MSDTKPRVIALISGKGGSGKNTISISHRPCGEERQLRLLTSLVKSETTHHPGCQRAIEQMTRSMVVYDGR